MAEKSIPEQIIDEFVVKVAHQGVLEPERLTYLKILLKTEKPKKADILKAIRGDD